MEKDTDGKGEGKGEGSDQKEKVGWEQWRIQDFRRGGARTRRHRRRGPRAAGARIETPKAPRGVACGQGCPLPTGRGVWGGGCAPSREIFFDFSSENSEFQCIMESI